ncbi:hypothetical protein SDRG_13105 [Saprolegnia diclina VS20]|uniref:ZZ-type domain-containing protein n=1 Tax=Saprolegnia diclina (strain VS20) TaxID=1156394 RepID=T0RHE7_SAPDV|nr:hypothetical protein SDRG_13105 [Saprolegnia diclina VS20]EQC29232.1 hypothetical protein SDRG_13105 [Saprolegnia diclina VS20]|eukprot:XP_008617410.1 hypothetical protein SDRG_13105 [Saprolegnia diclina VS20]
MIMHPWNDPVVLRRSWCVFEVYVAVTMKARFEMAMAPGQLGLLVHDILRPTALKDMLGTIKSEASETTVPSDRDGIFELIRAETSFTAVDRLIFSTILDWMKRTLTAQIASGLSPLDEAHRYLCLASIHATEMRIPDVVTAASRARLLFESLSICDNHYARVMTFLGRGYLEIGEPETTWRTIFENLLALDGLEPATVCSVRNAYANAMASAKCIDEARDISRGTYDIAMTHLGPMHRETASATSILGMTSYIKCYYDEAMQWFRKALDAQLSHLGADHPHTLLTRDYLALICFYRGQLVEARDLYEEITSRTLSGVCSAPATSSYIALMSLLAKLYWSRGDYDDGKRYLEMSLTWRLANLPPGDAGASLSASALYRFLLDPTFAMYSPTSDEAWAKVVAFFDHNELETEVWHGETCYGCSQPMQGLWFECATCPAYAFQFCSHCLRQGKSSTFCNHDTGSFKCYVPPRRYLLEQALVASATDQATATLWRDYQTYCTANKVPVDEQAPFASYAPIATRTWHPML